MLKRTYTIDSSKILTKAYCFTMFCSLLNGFASTVSNIFIKLTYKLKFHKTIQNCLVDYFNEILFITSSS